MTNKKDSTKNSKWQDVQKWLIVLAELAVIVGLIIGVIVICQDLGIAEDSYISDAWIICKPGDLVNVRTCPSNKSTSIGLYECGYSFRTDWEAHDGWIHAIDLPLEETEGWIYAGYVSAWEPEWREGEAMTISAEGRVACRRWCDGPRITGRGGWVQPGTTVQVFYWTPEWAVTNRGYIRAEYLGE